MDLRELGFDYDPETGQFTRWGKEVGSVNHRYDGYCQISLDRKLHKAHRFAVLFMTGALPDFPRQEVDHINGDRADNRWVNLRVVDRAQNMKNQKLRKNSTTRENGVTYDKSKGKWRVQLQNAGKLHFLGRYEHFADAVVARDRAYIDLDFHPNHGRPCTP